MEDLTKKIARLPKNLQQKIADFTDALLKKDVPVSEQNPAITAKKKTETPITPPLPASTQNSPTPSESIPSESNILPSFPQPLPTNEKDIARRFAGLNLAICENQIIDADKSLRILREKLRHRIPSGKRVLIEYIDPGVPFYELNL